MFISFYQDQKSTDTFPCYLRKKQSLDVKEKNEKLAALPQIATFCVASAFGQFFIFMCVSDFGPLPCSIITTTREDIHHAPSFQNGIVGFRLISRGDSGFGLPHPLSRKRVCPSPGIKGKDAHSPVGEGVGESQFRRLEKKHSTLLTL